MRVKDNTVNITAILPALVWALSVIDDVYESHQANAIITSGNDGTHSRTSLHYANAAVDIRMSNVPQNERQQVADQIKNRLGIDFDVILETNPLHLHVELQPRAPFARPHNEDTT